jgi:O-antigen ligase
MQRFLHRLRGWAVPGGRHAWAGALVLAFPLLSLVSGFGIGLASFLFAGTALAWRRDCGRLLRACFPHTRWVLLAFLLQLTDIAWLAAYRGHGITDLDGPVRMCMAVAAMLVVQAARPSGRCLWLGAAGGAVAALAFAAWQRLALGVERPGGLMNPITFGDLSLCLALLSLAGTANGRAAGEGGEGPRSLPLRWIAAAGIACGVVASLLTGSRGGWLALLLIALLLVPLACRIGLLPRRLALGLALLACVLAAASWAIPRTGVRERVAIGVSDARLYLAGNPAPTSLSVRLELWKAGAMLVRERPWMGRDTRAYKRRMREWIAQGKLSPAVFAPPEPPHLHNDVLQVLVTRGLTGLLAWGGILVAPACFFLGQLRVRRAHASPRHGARRAAALAGAMVVLAYAGFGLTEVIFWSMKASLFYALMVFLLMGYCLNGQEEGASFPVSATARHRIRRAPRRRRPALASQTAAPNPRATQLGTMGRLA